ncbi:MAG: RidA family protein [Rhizobiaceae bacterium]
MEYISTDQAPSPAGHYSQAVCHDGLCYISGILPVALEEPVVRQLSFEEQSDLVLAHAKAILAKAGLSPQDIIQARVYVTSVENWGIFNTKYAAFMGDHKPARAVVPVPELHHGFDIEIEMIARQK